MKRLMSGLAICLFSIPLLYAQQRPTLGPPPGTGEPSVRGPVSSRTTNPGKLLRMRKIYIQRISHNFNEVLTNDLAHATRVKVVNKQSEADAVVRGTCFTLRNLRRLHAEVYISERVTGASIWQDAVNVPFDPPTLSKAVDNAAFKILSDLNQSLREASKR